MFLDVTCSRCRRRHLVGHRAIAACANEPAGIRLEVSCPCGEPTVLWTGRRRARPAGMSTTI